MIYIAHRGNTDGPSRMENHPLHITKALALDFEVEVDIWYIDGQYILSHDHPDKADFKGSVESYKVPESYLKNDKFWHHAKDIKTLQMLNNLKPNNTINCFYHNTDDVTLTSAGWLWTYPGKEITIDSIAVMPELVKDQYDFSKAYGVCSDYVMKYSEE